MATQEQYEFYKLLFDEESVRERQLREQAKNYLSLATLYSAFVIFVANDKSPVVLTIVMKAVFIASILCMAAAFVLSFWVMQVSNYEAITDPEDVNAQYSSKPMKNDEFFENRIADLTVACSRNIKVNDRKAIFLECAGYALVLGILLHVGFFVVRFI